MREEKRRLQNQKLGFAYSGIIGYLLSAVHRKSKLAFITYLQFDDGGAGTGQYYISDKEFTHRIAIICVSAGGFGTGIGEIVAKLFGS